MSGDKRRRGDSSPTDSGVDTRDWEENQRGMQYEVFVPSIVINNVLSLFKPLNISA